MSSIAPSPPIYNYGVTPQDLWVAELAAMQSRAEVRATFNVRGGITTTVVARHPDKP